MTSPSEIDDNQQSQFLNKQEMKLFLKKDFFLNFFLNKGIKQVMKKKCHIKMTYLNSFKVIFCIYLKEKKIEPKFFQYRNKSLINENIIH